MKKPSLPQRLAVALLFEIASGSHRADKRFLSRREIMRHWQVADSTTRKALRLLVGWKILYPSDRSGHHFHPQFRQKALLKLNQTSLASLAARPRIGDKMRSLINTDRPFSQIAIISIHGSPHTDMASSPEVFSSDTPAPFTVRILAQTIFNVARDAGVSVDFFVASENKSTRQHIIDALLRNHTQGVIILRRRIASTLAPLAEPLLKAGIPLVVALSESEGLRAVSVNFNNVGIGYSAARQLIATGHRRIAVSIHKEESPPWYYRDRYHGCLLAAREHMEAFPNDPVTVSPIFLTRAQRNTPPRRLHALFKKNNPRRPTALFSTAVEVFESLKPVFKQQRLRIPADLSVIMCSSLPHCPRDKREIDIMKLDFERIGQKTFEALQSLHRGAPVEKVWLVDSAYEPHGTVATVAEAAATPPLPG